MSKQSSPAACRNPTCHAGMPLEKFVTTVSGSYDAHLGTNTEYLTSKGQGYPAD